MDLQSCDDVLYPTFLVTICSSIYVMCQQFYLLQLIKLASIIETNKSLC